MSLLTRTKTDNVDTDPKQIGLKSSLSLDKNTDPIDEGVILLTSASEFSVQHLTIGPGVRDFTVKIEENLGTVAVPQWSLIRTDTVLKATLTEYVWIPEIFKSYLDEVRITVTNDEATVEVYYFTLSATSRADMPGRKF